MSEKLTHWKKLTNPDYIGAYELEQGKDLVVTIEKVEKKIVKSSDGKDDQCTVATLKGHKPFIINATNAKTITKLFNSPYVEKWEGKSIILYATTVRAFGDTVECLRVRPSLPVFALPELTPNHQRWDGAKKAIAEGNITIEKIKEVFSLTPENEALLCN